MPDASIAIAANAAAISLIGLIGYLLLNRTTMLTEG
jgi:preprotein translocase subunit Sss1